MKRFLALCALWLLFALAPVHAPSCGGGEWYPEFFPDNAPNVPEADFRGGRLGIVRPSLYIRHLAVAYRYLAGRPLTGQAAKPPDSGRASVPTDDPWRQWQKARAQVTAIPAKPWLQKERKVPNGDFQFYANCNDSSIVSATSTLNNRIVGFGPTHEGVKAWVTAQDIVFDNCAEGTGTPAGPEAELPPLLAADRRYQIAAAHFYAGRFDDARAHWLAIAADRTSAWCDMAPYLAARCLIRKSTLGGEKLDEAAMKTASEELAQLGRISQNAEVRSWSAKLREYTLARLAPGEAFAALASRIADPSNDSTFEASVSEFDYLYVTHGVSPVGRDDLADWILAARGRMSSEESSERWRSTRTLPWLIWALAQARGKWGGYEDLLAAAVALRPESPGYATAAYHLVRLELEASRIEAARALLDDRLPRLRGTQPLAALNPFLSWRMALARDYEEFLANSVRRRVGWSLYGQYATNGPKEDSTSDFGADAAETFNRYLPLAAWRAGVDSAHLPREQQLSLRRALWVRAVLLGDHRAALAVSPSLRRAHKELVPGLTRYERAESDEAHRFEAAYTLLKSGLFPFLPNTFSPGGVRQMSDWCSAAGPRPDDQPSPLSSGPPLPRAAWLSPADRDRASTEVKRLTEQGTASNYIARASIAWAKAHPEDPRSPEALHLAVRATRFGCRDADTGTYSKAAFTLLHRNFPGSEWTRKTKFWYEGP